MSRGRKCCAVVLFLLCGQSLATAGDTEALRAHPSPYIAMHADDGVKWRLWQRSSIDEARRRKRLLFVTLGYFSCYWCHVLQRETFTAGQATALLNDEFVPVVVDRELHPALDADLSLFAEETIGRSGWPLNVVLTPEGYPLMATIYLPPQQFQRWLEKIAQMWREAPEYLADAARDAALSLSFEQPLTAPTKASVKQLERAFWRAFWQQADELAGGFGESSKFPLVAMLDYALDEYARRRDERLGEFLRLTLNNMAGLGLRDHLDGGFFRYVVDPQWQLPHFEKMLYDNALLIDLYARAAEVFADEEYDRVAMHTLDFLLRRMWHEQGGFIAALSAVDGRGVEGGYYLFTAEDLVALPASQRKGVMDFYAINGVAELEAGHLPLPRTMKPSPAQTRWREPLLKLRDTRVLPRDEKRLAGWNGLMLSALSRVLSRSPTPRYRQAAAATANMLTGLWRERELKSAVNVAEEGVLADYAYVSRGLADYAAATGEKTFAKTATDMAATAWRRFFSDQGWRPAANKLIPYGTDEAVIADGVLPSPSALLLELQGRLPAAGLEGRDTRALAMGQGLMQGAAFWYASQLDVLATSVAASK